MELNIFISFFGSILAFYCLISKKSVLIAIIISIVVGVVSFMALSQKNNYTTQSLPLSEEELQVVRAGGSSLDKARLVFDFTKTETIETPKAPIEPLDKIAIMLLFVAFLVIATIGAMWADADDVKPLKTKCLMLVSSVVLYFLSRYAGLEVPMFFAFIKKGEVASSSLIKKSSSHYD